MPLPFLHVSSQPRNRQTAHRRDKSEPEQAGNGTDYVRERGRQREISQPNQGTSRGLVVAILPLYWHQDDVRPKPHGQLRLWTKNERSTLLVR